MANYLTSTALGLVLASTPLFLAGGYWLKKFADTGSALAALTAGVFYLSANALFAKLMTYGGLSGAYLASAIATTAGTMAVSVWLFGEPWTASKTAAFIFLIAAAVALALPTDSRA